jgi:hypothetical protein
MSDDVPSDAERLDPANIRPWWCRLGSSCTVVLATCEGEAKGCASYWFERAGFSGRTAGITARPATAEDVERWRALRAELVPVPTFHSGDC